MRIRGTPSVLGKPKKQIAIICEGDEDEEYITHLRNNCSVWDKDIVLAIVKANSLSKIFDVYDKYYRKHPETPVVIFCDTETTQYKQFIDLKNDITKLRSGIPWDNLIYYVYPCTMQIVMFHFAYEILDTADKAKNTAKIVRYIGLKGKNTYRAKDEQRAAIMGKIDSGNYDTMRSNLKKFLQSYTTSSHPPYNKTNVQRLFDMLEGKNYPLLLSLV